MFDRGRILLVVWFVRFSGRCGIADYLYFLGRDGKNGALGGLNDHKLGE